MCCAGAPLMRGGGVVVRSRLAAGRGGGGGGRTSPPLGRGGGGVVVTPRRLKQLTPGYGELSNLVSKSHGPPSTPLSATPKSTFYQAFKARTFPWAPNTALMAVRSLRCRHLRSPELLPRHVAEVPGNAAHYVGPQKGRLLLGILN